MNLLRFDRGDVLAKKILQRIDIIGPEAAGEEFKKRGLMALPTKNAIKRLIPPRGHPEASRVYRIISRLRKQRVRPFVQFSALHQPTKEDEPPKRLPVFREGELLDYNVQRHNAKRAGLHRDVRIGNRKHGLLSWATRKKSPGPGEKVSIHATSVHPHSYLGWEGKIPSGYGAGTVKSEDLGKALVTKSTPGELHATLADRKGSHRLAFIKTKTGWLLSKGKTPTPPSGAVKPPAKSVSPADAHSHLSQLKPGSFVQPKIDGALVYVTTKGGRPEIFSHRVSKTTGYHPVHTERVFRGRPTIDIPREHQRTLVGELYGKVRGKAIPPQQLGGILNAHIGESIAKQKASGVRLKVMPFDVVSKKGTYSERLSQLKDTLRHLPKDVFHVPESVQSSGAALRLYHKVRSGSHSLTKEGVIIHPPEGKMVKIKNVEEANVKVHSTFPGSGKYKGAYGGFYYSGRHGERLGKVGTGFSDETRRSLHKYVGRTARVRYQEKYPSGKLRAPRFIAIEENK